MKKISQGNSNQEPELFNLNSINVSNYITNNLEEGHFYALNSLFTDSQADIQQNYDELIQNLKNIQNINQDQKIQDAIQSHRKRLDKAYDVLSNPQAYKQYMHMLKIRSYLNQKISDFTSEQQQSVQDSNSNEEFNNGINNNSNNGNFSMQDIGLNDQYLSKQLGSQQSGSFNYLSSGTSGFQNTLNPLGSYINNQSISNNNSVSNNNNVQGVGSNNNQQQQVSLKRQYPFFLFEVFFERKRVPMLMHFDFVKGSVCEEQNGGKNSKQYTFEQIYGKVYLNSNEEDITVNLIEENQVNSYNYRAKFQAQTGFILNLFRMAEEQVVAKKPLLKFISMRIDNKENQVCRKVEQIHELWKRDSLLQDDRFVPQGILMKQRVFIKKFCCRKQSMYLFLGYTHMIEAEDFECYKILRVIPLKQAFITFNQKKNELILDVMEQRTVYFFPQKIQAQEFCIYLNIALSNYKRVKYSKVYINKTIQSEQQQKRQKNTVEKLKKRIEGIQEQVQQWKNQAKRLQDEAQGQNDVQNENMKLLLNLKQQPLIQQSQFSPTQSKFGNSLAYQQYENINARYKGQAGGQIFKYNTNQGSYTQIMGNKYESQYLLARVGSEQKILANQSQQQLQQDQYETDTINEQQYQDQEQFNLLQNTDSKLKQD